MARGRRVRIVAIFWIVVGIVFADDFDDDADTNSERIPSFEHGSNQGFHAGLRNKLSRKTIWTNTGLLVLCSLGGYRNYSFQEVAC